MDYRAVITLDYTGMDPNEYQNLLNALEHVGWAYAETSAMYLECDEMQPIRHGLEVLARYLDAPGKLSACTVAIQLVGPEQEAPGAMTPSNAYAKVMGCELPSEQANGAQ